MTTRNSKIILAKDINVDKEYNSVLNYTEQQMLSLVQSKKVYENSNFSFIRQDENRLKVAVSYGTALQANYVAFQNPNYSNKWFFAWITNVKYISDDSTEIDFEVDEFSTWFDYWDSNQCFVVREHVNNDTVGSNTVPEDLETGEYICNEHYKDSTMDSYATDLCFIMASTSQPLAGDAKDTVAPSAIYNGIYTGLTYYRFDVTSGLDTILEIFANYAKTKAINGVFMAPKWLATRDSGVINSVQQSNTPATFNINVSKQTTLNGYSPVNNKLKCFPYNYLLVSNNIGQNAILHYEKFSGTNATFTVRGVLNPGCSINITPTNYNGSASSDIDAIQLGKFPICNFQNDMYTNWLTQNSINVLGMTITSDDINIASSVMGGISGAVTDFGAGNKFGAGMSIAGTGMSIGNAIMQKKQHNMIPNTVSGQLNSADVNVASGNNTFHFYKMSVKQEFARICDDYFTRRGYKINRVKQPNITGRRYWNYVQIADGEDIVKSNKTISVPANAMETINRIFRKGTTIWHDHANIGNFGLSNTII